jgi:hypothetical protein
MNWRVSLLVICLALGASPASAQLALPGAAPAAPADAPRATPKPKKAAGLASSAGGAAQVAKGDVSDPASVDGRPLMLNGRSGLLQVSGAGKGLQVDKLSLAGESASDSSQKCVVDIVGQKPIQAASIGRPDGLERFEVDVPACPFAFDVLNGAILVPPQIAACVFKAADCQTSPGGLWGPDADSLAKDPAAIAKQRSLAEKAMAKALQALEGHAKDNADAASLVRDQNAFAGQRDEQCRGYVRETALGYCAANLTAARAALLEARLEAMNPGAKADKEKAQKAASVKKKKKPKSETAAQPVPPMEPAPAPAQ